jgi:geranylgeranyl pyrophosphate synthase
VTAASSLHDYLSALRSEVDRALEQVLAERSAVRTIAEPVRYSLLGGGKRLRPCLTLAVAESVAPLVGLTPADARGRALPAACAVEMIHSYSLVHDDLPAMDDDDLRRGRPTTHVVYGDGMAILAGDALLTEAFSVLATWSAGALPECGARLRAIATLAASAGIHGMVGGQAIDLAAVTSTRTEAFGADALEDMHARKTGALIRAACTMGAIMTGASDVVITAVDAYARELGLAFQIIDDVLDVEGSNEALGKTAGKDAEAGKPTFPAFYGVAGSRARAAACISRANAALAEQRVGGRLSDIAEWSLGRDR